MQSGTRTATSSARPGASPMPKSQSQVNTQTKVIDSVHGRILCIADVRGRLSSLNDMAREAGAKAIIHTGDFGFFEASSLERINDRTLKHLTQYSPLIPNAQRAPLLAPDAAPSTIRSAMNISLLSEFPLLLSGQIKLSVPVFTVWGACEDVVVLEKFRQGTCDIENLHVIDEATTRCLDIGGIKLRILGLGGAFVPHKMFDNGDGRATIAGGQGTMWTTALQIGELVDTAQRVYDPSETRLLVSHASPGREGIIAQLALVLKADLTISAGLHFRYTSSWNEFSVQGDFEGFRHKILSGKDSFDKIWESVKPQVEAVVDENQRILLDKALHVVSRVPAVQAHIGPGATATGDEPSWKTCWNWNLCDAAYGSLILDIKEGRVSAELKSQGFNYAYRRSNITATPSSATSALPNANAPPSSSATPAPQKPQPLSKSNGVSASSTPPPQAGKAQQQQQQSFAPASGKDTPRDVKIPNGSAATATSPADKSDLKNKKEKFKKDKRDGKDTDGERPDTPAGSEKAGIAPDAATVAGSTDGGSTPMSPIAGEGGSGRQTPTFRKPMRSPWTLHLRAPATVQDSEVRDFFGDAKRGIVRVNLGNNPGKKPQISVFVIFLDEEAMKLGQEKHHEKILDFTTTVSIAEDQPHRGAFRARGRGGLAARGFASAGLTRNSFSDRRANAESAKDS